MDWTLEVDGPEVMTWGAVTASGAQLRVSTSYSSSYSWCVYTFQGWHVTGGYGDSIADAKMRAELAALRNGLM